MKKLGLALAAVATMAVASAPALAETTVIKKRHEGMHKKVVIKKHGEGGGKVVIKKHGD
jgi:hypothetical protein